MVNANATINGSDLLKANIKSVAILPIESFDALLSNNVRLSIMNALSNGPMTVTALSRRLNMLKGVVHRHVKILEDFGWIRQLSDEEVRNIGLSREANRIYYVPSAFVYLGFRIDSDERGIRIVVPTNYGAFVDLRGRRFILFTPTLTTHECRNTCLIHDSCLEWVKRIGKQYHVSIDEEDAARALMQLYTQLVIREFRVSLINNVMLLDSPRLNLILMKQLNLAL
ncbi:MAG: winged helix-turn-helix domain-containing protein [Vulcanisaeta sp.]|jgi:DNA-binding transcriptional ArsR family regulator|nr:winged helix-turn-helix domain-containing protein [Vulcanisaeta sp.]